MQFITLLVQCHLYYIALQTVKMCDKMNSKPVRAASVNMVKVLLG